MTTMINALKTAAPARPTLTVTNCRVGDCAVPGGRGPGRGGRDPHNAGEQHLVPRMRGRDGNARRDPLFFPRGYSPTSASRHPGCGGREESGCGRESVREQARQLRRVPQPGHGRHFGA